jgi:hypothetical protein
LKYKNTGQSDFLGHPPGDEFEADLPEAQEKRAIARGSLARVGDGQSSEASQTGDGGEGDKRSIFDRKKDEEEGA